MTPDLVLWNAERCPYCSRVRIALAEKGLPWTERAVHLARKPPELFQLNPPGAVPVLVEGATVVPESLVILEYLEDRFPEPPLLPRDAAGRAAARLLAARVSSGLAAAVGRWVKGGPLDREAAELAMRDALAGLERDAPRDGFFGGKALGFADVALLPFVIALPRHLTPLALGHRHLSTWLERALARPGMAHEQAALAPPG
jgi:glutathione S-transferase